MEWARINHMLCKRLVVMRLATIGPAGLFMRRVVSQSSKWICAPSRGFVQPGVSRTGLPNSALRNSGRGLSATTLLAFARRVFPIGPRGPVFPSGESVEAQSFRAASSDHAVLMGIGNVTIG